MPEYEYDCVLCKRHYTLKKHHPLRKYCGRVCHHAAMSNPMPLCKICGAPRGKARNKVYCSAECRAVAKKMTEAKPKKKYIRKSCYGVVAKRDLPITPEIKTLYKRALLLGARAAGREIGLNKNMVLGRLWRRGLSLARGELELA